MTALVAVLMPEPSRHHGTLRVNVVPAIRAEGAGPDGSPEIGRVSNRTCARSTPQVPLVAKQLHHIAMAERVKKCVSVPSELDVAIRAAADRSGMTYSGWLANAAHRALRIEAGLAAVAEYEAERGAFTSQEQADADTWLDRMIAKARPSEVSA